MSGFLPIPPPFPTPVPNPDLIDSTALWDYENISNLVSAFRTVLIMADAYSVVTAFLVGGLIVAVIIWMARLIGNRESNV